MSEWFWLIAQGFNAFAIYIVMRHTDTLHKQHMQIHSERLQAMREHLRMLREIIAHKGDNQ